MTVSLGPLNQTNIISKTLLFIISPFLPDFLEVFPPVLTPEELPQMKPPPPALPVFLSVEP